MWPGRSAKQRQIVQPHERSNQSIPVTPSVFPEQKYATSGSRAQVEASVLSLVRCLSSFSSDLISPSKPISGYSWVPKTHVSIAFLRTLHIMFRLDAFQFQPAPVQDLVCEDGDEGGLEDRSTAVFVEVALLGISDR